MYTNTKLANGCRVTEKCELQYGAQHIVETIDGYIIRITFKPKDGCIILTSTINDHFLGPLLNRMLIPIENYKALRAAYKAMIAFAPLHRSNCSRY